LRPFRYLISLEEAMSLMLSKVEPIKRVEKVGIDEAVGRVLAEDVVACIDIPSFDRAAMDGYAVKAKDTFDASQYSPAKFKLVAELSPEQDPSLEVGEMECVRVATGCKIPRGADSVVMLEHTEPSGEHVLVYRPVHPWENVSKRGSDIGRGTKPLRSGDFLTPARVGVLAALGRSEVLVLERPRVAVVPTGDELVELGRPLDGAKVYDVNSHTVGAVVRENGCVPVVFPITPDDEAGLLEALKRALEFDMVVVTGGSSVGAEDLMGKVLESLGEVLFHGIQIKPGKPTVCAVAHGKLILGMPGHPTSCLSNSYLMLVALCRRLAGLPEKHATPLRARLSRRVVSTLGRKFFLTVKLEGGLASPVFKESSAITSMADADGYVVIPENADVVEAGDEVEVYPFL
jgi:molybdenum cofactor synthesis domain-containing protein